MDSAGQRALASRREQFKNFAATTGAKAGDRRKQQAVTVGKDRREAMVRAKRIRRDMDDGLARGEMQGEQADEAALATSVKEAVEALRASKGKDGALVALRQLRKLLSVGQYPPVDVAVAAGAVPLLGEALQFGVSGPEQLLEAAWCLTNIASGDTDQATAVLPTAPLLIAHLQGRALDVAEQFAWALGNLAGEGQELRDVLLANGALGPLSARVAETERPGSTLKQTAAWALSNLLKGPSQKAASEAIKNGPLINALVAGLDGGSPALVTEVAWILTYLAAGPEAHADRLIKLGALPPLVRHLVTATEKHVVIPVLRAVGNVVSGQDSKTDAVFVAAPGGAGSVVAALCRCLQSGERTLQKEAAWAVANIAGGTLQHKQAVATPDVIAAAARLLQEAAFDVKKEAGFALANMCAAPGGGGAVVLSHLEAVVRAGCLPGFLALVRSPDQEAARLGVQFAEVVLRALPNGRGVKLVEEADGIDALESLQYHGNDELRNMANSLVDRYYGEEYGMEEEGLEEGSKAVQQDLPAWRNPGGMRT
ncbi:Karyopherin (importin) alpha [Klebsormidium nitens]|uniref:Importin subunit alpha n=1 Tax=Klebsormidium nitens TaxID=105231 RepID=A0A1Y1I773_KLENI|nr:Karyopherin (importin) alpha [Klebsormidium nitens]|eukprot:GAQ85782.1 Karyopherin (importin) alpha [Klebsormidium nitens]